MSLPKDITHQEYILTDTNIDLTKITPLELKNINKQDKFKKYTTIKKFIKKSGIIYDTSKIAIGILIYLI
jgi:hypothetical protein